MQIPLQITFRGMQTSPAVDAAIRSHAAKLEQFYSRITSCRVVLEQVARHHRKGREFVAHIDLKLPGGEIAVKRDHDEDVMVALRDAFDATTRKLEDFAREQRGD
jgi:ribosome-associated translation inhibitor RaiA